jgi:redox-sensitive bicupin YhaK (pirin superfamily)
MNMDRKKFIRNSLMAAAAGITLPGMLAARQSKVNDSTYDKLMHQVGFNHLPNKENITMNTVLHKANTRGHANHGWLDSHHTFSFANYYNPDRMHFGVLRVLNDDRVAAGEGFGTHPHDNMEIISIPLEGDLQHKDSMGNVAIIKEGDVQVMSAGTGIFHSEYNKNDDREVKFLQIWLFPREKNVQPRYGQISIRDIEQKNKFYQILSPNKNDQGVWIHQDAWFSLGNFEKGKTDTYKINKSGNGVYAFILEGEAEVGGQLLEKRDGFGIWETDKIDFNATSDARVLLMEVPMKV